MAEVRVDRETLKEIVTSLRRPGGENEWCVACGAGAASTKLDYPAELIHEAGRQFLDPKALREFVSSIRDVTGDQAWCVACGAGAAASPLSRVLPADVSDAFIEDLAQKLTGAVKIG